MIASPVPVHDTPPIVLSAYVPLPISALSPTRPGRLPVTPPVDVAAAIVPYRSLATPPDASTVHPASTAARMPSRSSDRPSPGSAPAPPCTMIDGTRAPRWRPAIAVMASTVAQSPPLANSHQTETRLARGFGSRSAFH